MIMLDRRQRLAWMALAVVLAAVLVTLAVVQYHWSRIAGLPLAIAPGDTLAGMAVDPSSKFFYLVDRSAGTIFGYTIATDGTLAAISGFPVNTGSRTISAPESIAIETGGKFLYVTNRNDNSVTSFTIGSGGGLTLLATQTTNIGATPIDLAIVH